MLSLTIIIITNKGADDKVIEEIKKDADTGGHAIAIQADLRKQTQVEYVIGEASNDMVE